MRPALAAILFLFFPVAASAETFRDCTLCPEMTIIPAGAFRIGSPEEETGREAHEGPRIEIPIAKPFALSVAEITVGQFRAFADATGYPADGPCFTFDGLNWDARPGFSWAAPGYVQTDDHPAACLNLEDATAYARWLSRKTGATYRLPTEAEWEYAARAGRDGHRIPPADLCDAANGAAQESGFDYRNRACRDGHAYAAPVRAYPANGFGLYGMLGNLLEWTQDCYAPDHTNADPAGGPNPSGDCRYRVMKGGNWAAAPQHLRPANRGINTPGARWSTNGLRLVRELGEAS